MITITLLNGMKFRYYGSIILENDRNLLWISARRIYNEIWDAWTNDAFWFNEIDTIKGKDDNKKS